VCPSACCGSRTYASTAIAAGLRMIGKLLGDENRFREREVARVMRAAKTSKLPVKEIIVDPKTGKI
jgi:hypothetical protein